MTVRPDTSPSRAGSLPLVGGDLALDFANTESGRTFASHRNHFREPANVLDWLAHSGVLPEPDAAWLRAETTAKPDLGRTFFTQALALREAIHGVASAIGRHETPPEDSLATLSHHYARLIDKAELAVVPGHGCRWRWPLRQAPVEAALGPVALAAVHLLAEGDLSRVKECGGHACGWVFYDTTKNNRRRWCEMEVCGNRAKQKRLAARKRGA